LKHQARDLQRGHAAGDAEAVATVEKHLPDLSGRLILAKAQTVIAREYGFESWAKLRIFLFESVDRFCATARANDVEQLDAMLAEDPRLLNALDRKGWNGLCHAGSKETIAFLQSRGALSPPIIREQEEETWNRLHGATWGGDVGKAREMLDEGFDILQTSHHHQSSNTTVLHNAVQSGNVELLELLLEKGGTKLLESRLAPGEEGRKSGLTPLQLAVSVAWKNREQVAKTLLRHGAHYDGFSAAALGDADRVGELIGNDPSLIDSRDDYESTLLHWAARGRSVEAIDLLIEKGADVNGRNFYGETPLIMAASKYWGWKGRSSPAEAAARLIENGAEVDVFAAAAMGDTKTLADILDRYPDQARAVNEFDTTPLHFAAWNGHVDATKLLMDRGADLDAEDRSGCPPVFYASYWGKSWDTVELLLQNGASLTYRNMWGKGQEAYDADVDNMYFMARQGGQDIHNAAMEGDVDRVRSLLDEDGDRLKSISKLGAAPLHFAAIADQPEVILLLLERGGDVDAPVENPNRPTPKRGDPAGYTPMFLAAHAGAAASVEHLISNGADVNVTCRGWGAKTILHGMGVSYAERGDVERTVDLLVKAGIDVNSEGALHMAAWFGKARLISRLIRHGADVNQQDSNGDSPLHRAAESEKPTLKTMQLLIDNGADVNAKNNLGKTPLDAALEPRWTHPNPDRAELLRSHGGKRGDGSD
jgi:cytohesin